MISCKFHNNGIDKKACRCSIIIIDVLTAGILDCPHPHRSNYPPIDSNSTKCPDNFQTLFSSNDSKQTPEQSPLLTVEESRVPTRKSSTIKQQRDNPIEAETTSIRQSLMLSESYHNAPKQQVHWLFSHGPLIRYSIFCRPDTKQQALLNFKIAKVNPEGFRFLAKLVTTHALDVGEVEDRGGETVEHSSAEVVGHVVAKLVNIDDGHARPLSRICALLTTLKASPCQQDAFSLPG